MTMQFDVKQAHLDQSGFMVKYPVRVKGLSFTGGASTGYATLFDTSTVPVSASVTYGRSGTTVTVTKTAHGLTTGTVIGIHFVNGTGGSATDGTYAVTVLTADTFTVTDINSGTITGAPAAIYTPGKWLITQEVYATNSQTYIIAGEGVRAETGVYGYVSGLSAIAIYYG
jgi:hypothetical protein